MSHTPIAVPMLKWLRLLCHNTGLRSRSPNHVPQILAEAALYAHHALGVRITGDPMDALGPLLRQHEQQAQLLKQCVAGEVWFSLVSCRHLNRLPGAARA